MCNFVGNLTKYITCPIGDTPMTEVENNMIYMMTSK